MIDPIDRIWIPGGFQPSVQSETAYILSMSLEDDLSSFFENLGILSTPGWLYVYIYVHVYAYVCICIRVYMYII